MAQKTKANTRKHLTKLRAREAEERVAGEEYRASPHWRRHEAEMRRVTKGCEVE